MSAQSAARLSCGRPRTIRPKVIFGMIEDRYPAQNIEFKSVMPPTDIGGLTLLEGALIASLVKLRGATHLFEFGTYKGATAVLLAANSADDARIVTLDIEASGVDTMHTRSLAARSSADNDHYLRTVRASEGARYVRQAPPALQSKITQILHDSVTLDLQAHAFESTFDFIFIDGGHDYATVRSDSEKAFAMASKDAVIVWHDYGSSVHGDVTRYVDALSETRDIVHVEASMLAISWGGLSVSRIEGPML